MKQTSIGRTISILSSVIAISAAAPALAMNHGKFSQDGLPEAVKVPAGNVVMLEAVGAGEITYECRAKKDLADQFDWVFVGPDAKLNDRAGKQIGKYYGPPATWEASDGSKVTATQLATAPGGNGNLPLQLVKANPASGAGAMQGVSFIQRLATKGGIAPASVCAQANLGEKQIVQYQADYIFWKAE